MVASDTSTSRSQPHDAAPDSAPRSFLAGCIRAIPFFAIVVLAACAPTWLGLAARWHWVLDLTTHFTWFYAALMPVLLIACWMRRRPRLALMAVLTLALNIWRLAPLYVSPPDATSPDAQLRVMTQNVLKKNASHDAVVKLIQQESPDVVLLVEVNQKWIRAMRPIESLYPHYAFQLRNTRSGIALYSRLPLDELRFEKLSQTDRYSAIARLKVEGKSITIVGVHATLPHGANKTELRNAELLAVARFVANEPDGVIMMGDLNTTPWSPAFGDLLRDSGLRNSMRGFGVQPTWGLAGWDRVVLPIDHVLHTLNLAVIDRRIGPHVGSDHRAVIVDFSLTER